MLDFGIEGVISSSSSKLVGKNIPNINNYYRSMVYCTRICIEPHNDWPCEGFEKPKWRLKQVLFQIDLWDIQVYEWYECSS